MPDSVMTLFPHLLRSFEAMKMSLQAALAFNQVQMQTVAASVDNFKSLQELTLSLARQTSHFLPAGYLQNGDKLLKLCQEGAATQLDIFEENVLTQMNRFYQKRAGELDFLKLFTNQCPRQDWTAEYDPSKILLDLPGLRVIDISADVRHRILNYGVVFAPRAGHHSNIAERVALFLRDN